MRGRKRKKNHKRNKAQAKFIAWSYREYLKLPHTKLDDQLLQQIASSRRQKIVAVHYEPYRITIVLG
jgi:hypothetical protein